MPFHVLPHLQESLVTYSVAIGTPSQSPLKANLDRAVIRVFEAGLCKYWKLRSYILYRQVSERTRKREVRWPICKAPTDNKYFDSTVTTLRYQISYYIVITYSSHFSLEVSVSLHFIHIPEYNRILLYPEQEGAGVRE